MSRKPKSPGGTRPRQFRLGDDTVADLDLIADHQTRATGVRHSRADAVRVAARREAGRIRRRGET
jgi:hypothetical protein